MDYQAALDAAAKARNDALLAQYGLPASTPAPTTPAPAAPAAPAAGPYPGYTFQPLSAAEQAQLTQTLGSQGVNATDGGRFVDANGKPMADASGKPYVMDQFGHDLGWANMVAQRENNDAQNNTRGLDLTLLGIAGATAAGLATAGAVGGAAAAGGGGAAAGEAAATFPYEAPGASIVGSAISDAGAAAAPVAAAAGGGAPAATATETASGFPSSAVSAGPDPDMLKGGALGPASTTFDSVTSFLKDNKDLVGAVLAGLGKGIISGNEVAAKAQADQDLLKLRYNLTAANYRGANPNNTYRGLAQPTGNPSPTEKFTVKPLDMSSFGGYEWQYDRAQGRIVRVPVTPTRQQSA